jgi:DNA-directed RNA polymerase subunit L
MVKINIISQKKTKDLDYSELKIKFSDISIVYVNTIKRLLYEYIPTYAFNVDNIYIEKSNTFLDNSRLRDRFQYLPIINIENNIDFLENKFLNVDYSDLKRERHPDEKIITVKFKSNNTEEKYKNITTNNISYYIDDNEIDNPYNQKFPFLFNYLRNGEHIECSMISSLGIGLIHPIYQPVYHTYYYEDNNDIILVVHSKGQITELDLLKKSCRIAKILLENEKKTIWNLLHEVNIFSKLVYEYKEYHDPDDIKNLTMDNFTLANIICEELQKDTENIKFAGVYKENYFDKIVHLKIRFNPELDKKENKDQIYQEILINAIDKCIVKFDKISKELDKL